MSKYTTELRWVVEQTLNDLGLSHDEANWKKVYSVLGLDDYPIFDELYRETLNNKIIRHYYTREIGAETVARFRWFVRDAMFLIMPYYNQLYNSEIVFKRIDPLTDTGMKRTEHAWGNTESTGTSESKTHDETQNVYSDTPQSEMIPAQIKNLQYATNVSLDDNDATSNGSMSSNGSYDNMVERSETGYTRSQSELLMQYRETFLNIDKMVVQDVELSQCFMTIW